MIIGVTGLAGAGKDTVASYLVSNYGFTRYAFADKVKALALEANPYLYGESDTLRELVNKVGWDKAKENIFVREFLQGIGHGARQVFGDNFWVDQLFNEHLAWQTVVSDVRYENEFKAVRDQGGYIVRVARNVKVINNHITETGHLDLDVDYTLNNNGSKRDLYVQIIDLMYKEFGIS